ncbi:MAG: hypothetical protein JWP37_2679 [Mucilaginibacter sp.]|nr:hypothetical protein [Mucilaginibacter sp.]
MQPRSICKIFWEICILETIDMLASLLIEEEVSSCYCLFALPPTHGRAVPKVTRIETVCKF